MPRQLPAAALECGANVHGCKLPSCRLHKRRSLGVCRTWDFDGIRDPLETGLSEISQCILAVCARKLRKFRADRVDEGREVAKSDKLPVDRFS
jgi:hypothetical protein